MFAITGITGKVGGALVTTLLAAGLPVRAVVRDATKGAGLVRTRLRSRSRRDGGRCRADRCLLGR